MIVLEAQYDPGLNGGLKIAKFIKKNVASAKKDISIKNAINVVKTVAPLALSLVPVVGTGAGSAVGKILTKVTTNANGSANLIGRIADGVQKVSQTNVGKSVIKLASPLVKNATTALLQGQGQLPNDEQIAAIAEQKGTTPQQELDAIVSNVPDTLAAASKVATPVSKLQPAVKDNTMLYVGGTVVGAAILYAVLK